MDNEKLQDKAKSTVVSSELIAVLDRLNKQAWTRSTVEEVISTLWVIASVVSFGFNFNVFGWIFAIKATLDMFASIWAGWREAVADKRGGQAI